MNNEHMPDLGLMKVKWLWLNFQLQLALDVVFFGNRESLFHKVTTSIWENSFVSQQRLSSVK